MACCSKDPLPSNEVQNDSEIEVTLSNSCDEIFPDFKEKSLSPILNTSSVSRKFLMGNRLRRNKSRVKLTDRFIENEKRKKSSVENNSTLCIPDVIEDFTLSQTDCLLTRIKRLEEIEKYRQNIYKLMVAGDRNGDFCFKKPISPAPNKIKKVKIVHTNENDSGTVEGKSNVESFIQFSESNQIDLPKCSGFQTATGMTIAVSDTDIKKHSKLFEDIINPSQNCDTGRSKKFAFLSKSKSNICITPNYYNPIKPVLSENALNVSKLTTRNVLNRVQTTFNSDISSEALRENTSSYITEADRYAKDLQCYKNKEVMQKSYDRIDSISHTSLTQQICDSGISNTQMLCAMDDALSAIDCKINNKCKGVKDFKGFDKKETTEAQDLSVQFMNIYRTLEHNFYEQVEKIPNKKSIFSINRSLGEDFRKSEDQLTFRKHVMKDLPLPPKKRHCGKFECVSSGDNWTPTTRNNETDGQVTENSSASDKMITTAVARNVDFFQNGKLSEKYDMIFREDNLHLTSNNSTLGGFSSASGKSIKVSDNSWKKAKSIFDNIDLESSKENLNKVEAPRISIAPTISGSSWKTRENIKKIKPEEKRINGVNDFPGAPATSMNTCNNSLQSVKHIFDDFDLKFPETKMPQVNLGFATTSGFQTASGIKLQISAEALRRAQKDFKDIVLKEKVAVSGIQMASSGKLIPEETLRRPQSGLDLAHEETISVVATPGFHTAGGSKLNSSEEALRKASRQHLNDTIEDKIAAEVVTPIKKSCVSGATGTLGTKPKRRLGVSACKQIQISDRKINKAKLLFEEDFCSKSPLRPKTNAVHSTTPVRQNFCSTPIKNDFVQSSNNFSSFIDSTIITPIKVNIIEEKVDLVPVSNSTIMLASPTKGSTFDWINELETERKKLEDRLKIVVERQKVLGSHKEEKLDENKRPRKGILYQSKSSKPRISLSSLAFKKQHGYDNPVDAFHDITPQNAENVHFKRQLYDSVITEDGAVIIPSAKDIVGLSEIENAFKAMPGVESRLIPSGWLRNHYKWIIWKLASYERMFPAQLNGCLSVENVVQQLKYRYDREIDRAERSALRKIFEKDDAPQKRMVLCVSKITKINAFKYELELSDGWYAIRTVLDEALCYQISRGKIKVGTKLMICGAELLNCDGCYPLESTNLTCLRINFNSTRRAIWYAKLGYQKNPGPFPIQIHSIHPLGGLTGAIRVCIVRVYPFNYFERQEGFSVWRNQKAEELRAQKWDNERCKKLEQILENVTKDFGRSTRKQNFNVNDAYKNISDINCPKTLYDMLRSSKDPDCFQHMLSSSQKRAILDYQNNVSMRKQEEIASKVKEDAEKLKLTKRNVVAVLKLRVVDAKCSPDKPVNFVIWEPTESHMQILKEGKSFTVKNVLAKKNGDLGSNMKTMFLPEPSNQNLYNRFKRRLTHIAELNHQNVALNFNEFDTIGVVVQTKIDVSGQEVWLSDNAGRLLLVHIYEGPSTCMLLDNLKRGQATTICNLAFHGLRGSVVQGLANHFTVVSSYSQHRHLQEGLDIFKKELPKDMDNFLKGCDSKIELFKIKNSDIKNSFCTNFEDSEEDTLVSSRITSADIALSLMDLDKYT